MTTDSEKSDYRDLPAARSLERMISVWKRLALERQGASVIQDGNIVDCWASSPLIFMNIVFVMHDSDKAGLSINTLGKASTLLQEKSEPGLVLLVEEQLGVLDNANLQHNAKTVGLAPRQGLWGMECTEISPCSFEHGDFEIRRVIGSQAVEMIAEINGAAYEISSQDVTETFSGSMILERDSVVFAGFENDIPVSVAVTFADGDAVYLALVATKPAAQRKGYGTATVQRALLEGRRAFSRKRFVLHSTAEGFRLYERLGFSVVARMRLFELTQSP